MNTRVTPSQAAAADLSPDCRDLSNFAVLRQRASEDEPDLGWMRADDWRTQQGGSIDSKDHQAIARRAAHI
jgi:hypothetical protein